jgi:hypothetical protein
MTEEIETQLGSLLAGINSLMAVQRYLNPVLIDQLKEKVSARLAPLENARRLTAESEWPDGTEAIRQSIDTSFELTQKAITAFVDTPDDPDGILWLTGRCGTHPTRWRRCTRRYRFSRR